MENKIPIFLKGHPLKLLARLKFIGYDPVFSFNLPKNVAIENKTVVVSVSLMELVSTIHYLKKLGYTSVRIMSFGEKKELQNLNHKFFSIYKKPDFNIKPKTINIQLTEFKNTFDNNNTLKTLIQILNHTK